MTVDEGDARAINFNFHAKLLKCGPHRLDLTAQAYQLLFLCLALFLVGADDALLQLTKLLDSGTSEDKEATDNDAERDHDAWQREQQVFRHRVSAPRAGVQR